MALETGLMERERSITALGLLFSFCMVSTRGKASYNNLAAHIEADGGESVSKQSVWKKVTEPCKVFFEKVLEQVLLAKIDRDEIMAQIPDNQFKRILVQDSTIIKLPARLFEVFSGVSNQHARVCNARIQGAYDLISEQFVSFSIDPYSKNDLKAAPELPVQQDDLVLRDRGYLINDEFKRHIESLAHCIFRYKYGAILLNPKSGKPIDILKTLKKTSNLDMEVMLNNEDKTIVRLTAAPVSEEMANSRRRKAKKENKYTPSKEYLKLLSWSIYLTTIPKEKASYSQILKVYRVRWRIEIIFKSWKSYMCFDHIHNVSQIQLHVLLLARFIMTVIYIQHIFPSCQIIVAKHSDKRLSLLKITQYLSNEPQKLVAIVEEINQYQGKIQKNITALIRYCTYDKRKRKNFEQQMEGLFNLS